MCTIAKRSNRLVNWINVLCSSWLFYSARITIVKVCTASAERMLWSSFNRYRRTPIPWIISVRSCNVHNRRISLNNESSISWTTIRSYSNTSTRSSRNTQREIWRIFHWSLRLPRSNGWNPCESKNFKHTWRRNSNGWNRIHSSRYITRSNVFPSADRDSSLF